MTGLEEFYVITDTGMCVFAKTRQGQEAQDVDLVAGYINALNAFSMQMSRDRIRSVHFGRSKLIIQSCGGMQFVAKVGPDARSRMIRQKLTTFATRFFEKFPPDFIASQWRGDVDIFASMDGAFRQCLGGSNSRMYTGG